MQTNLLFVYGSLLSGFKSPAYEYIKRYFKLLGDATVKGTLYDMGEFPAARPDDTGRTIKGELYEVINPNEFSFALAQLDDYEGLYPEEGEELLYARETVEVDFKSQTSTAWIYWYCGDVYGRPVLESGDMREYGNEKKQ